MRIICAVIILLFSFVSAQNYYESCWTPNRASGSCVPIKSCASIVRVLQTTITPQVREYLRQSQCKIDAQPWVCCPNSTPTQTAPPPPAPTAAPRSSSLPRPLECGVAAPNRIFGGEETKIDEFPWLAQIQYNKPGNKLGFHCGGSLINHRYVITAAHCIAKVPTTWKLTGVRLGEWDTTTTNDCDDSFTTGTVCSDPHVDVSVEEKIVHEDYEPNSKNQHHDIALLRLSKYVQYTDYISPVCLPLDSALRSLTLGKTAMEVAGWGKTETSSSSTKKLKVEIEGYTNAKCQSVYSASNNQIIDGQICAGGKPGKDSCNGDSGGPLMRYHEQGSKPHYFLAGIVSYGPRNCGTPDVPGVYTRTSKYIEWIESKIRE